MKSDLKKLRLNQETIRNITAQFADARLTNTQASCSCDPHCESTNTIHCFGERRRDGSSSKLTKILQAGRPGDMEGRWASQHVNHSLVKEVGSTEQHRNAFSRHEAKPSGKPRFEPKKIPSMPVRFLASSS